MTVFPSVSQAANPLVGEIPAEVQLEHAPLVLAICQIRFPAIASIARQDFIGPFQERLRSTYPILRSEHGIGVLLTAEGVSTQQQAATTWRFSDPDANWQISLAPDFLSLQVSRYSTRDEFIARLGQALEALEALSAPAIVDRIGVRYINELTENISPSALRSFVREELLGITPLTEGTADVQLVHSLNDVLIALENGQLRVRWGYLPSNTILDPAMPPADKERWFLDLDMFQQGRMNYGRELLLSHVDAFAGRIYSFFRWVALDPLLDKAGQQT